MFGFFASQEKKMRENAANWLELADKVYQYRRDVLTESQVAELRARTTDLQAEVKARAGAEKLKLGIERLEEVLKRTGGAIYPKGALIENVEFFLVAAIVILGIRTYFVQPFKIPTNSMWPTYNGMTPEVFKSKEAEPSVPAVAARLAVFGAWPHRLDAPDDGEILVPVGGESRGIIHCKVVAGRSWLVIPTQLREYTLVVGQKTVTTRLPMDFDFDWAIYDAFFARAGAYSLQKLDAEIRRKVQAGEFERRIVDGQELPCVRTGKKVRSGERALSFDELTGDQLFVDRFSYHFFQPSVGNGFVFRTGNIPDIVRQYGDQYYIKRLVGTPGDQLEIKDSALFRNGQPIAGSKAFDGNAKRVDRYTGYVAMGVLKPGDRITVPADRYFALGDNSSNSQDGRYWGYVPGKDVVGRPFLVYFPFTRHWGAAQ
ncbi:MAG: signal peptidase [Verrucomicrobiota bacterium]|jgi:signal peptidase I